MSMGAAEVLTFVVVFGAILAAYTLGQLRHSSRRNYQQNQQRRNLPSAELLLEYRNATGFTTLRKIRIVGYQPRPHGRSCVFALCNNGTAPRSFRVDRIISMATLDGEVLDTQNFLAEQLGVVGQA
jgi:hypothetical protein